MRFSVHEILALADKQPSREYAIAILRQYHHPVLLQVLAYAFDPDIVWLLPETDPPYKPCPTGEAQGALYNQARKLYLFVKGGNDNLQQSKRETIFIQFLESIDPEDAKVILAAKNKKIPFENITSDLVQEAFPELQWASPEPVSGTTDTIPTEETITTTEVEPTATDVAKSKPSKSSKPKTLRTTTKKKSTGKKGKAKPAAKRVKKSA